MCNEFNDGKPLEYKFTEPGGYYRLTKGFTAHGLREIDACKWLRMIEFCKRDLEVERQKELRSRGRPKKVHMKYVGDLYE